MRSRPVPHPVVGRRWSSGRLARLLAIAAAAAASVATGASPAPTAPTASGSSQGSTALSSDAPVAVLAFDVSVAALELGAGAAPVVRFVTSAQGADPADRTARVGEVRASVVPADEHVEVSPPFRSISSGVNEDRRGWSLACTADPCVARFLLALDWIEPRAGSTIDVTWRLEARVEVETSAAAEEAAVTVTAPTVAGDASAVAADGVAAPVRLEEGNRLRLWQVTWSRGEPSVGATWPIIAAGRIIPTREDAPQPAPGATSAHARLFVEPEPGDGDRFTAVAPSQWLEFDPFAACPAREACEVSRIVGLDWQSQAVDQVVDAGWRVELRALTVDGEPVPIDVRIEPLPEMPVATRTIRGTAVLSANPMNAGVEYDVRITEGAPGRWAGLARPVRGLVRAVATSTGAPIEPTTRLRIGSWVRSVHAQLGQAVELPFDPTRNPSSAACRVPDCNLDGGLRFEVDRFGDLPAGWEISVDWELEIGAGVADPGGRLEIDVVP